MVLPVLVVIVPELAFEMPNPETADMLPISRLPALVRLPLFVNSFSVEPSMARLPAAVIDSEAPLFTTDLATAVALMID